MDDTSIQYRIRLAQINDINLNENSDLFKTSVLRTYYDTMKNNAHHPDMAHKLSIAAVQEKHGARGLEHIEKHLDVLEKNF
jgi:ABC-type antimicrobial peptide transport system ATPase subunit